MILIYTLTGRCYSQIIHYFGRSVNSLQLQWRENNWKRNYSFVHYFFFSLWTFIHCFISCIFTRSSSLPKKVLKQLARCCNLQPSKQCESSMVDCSLWKLATDQQLRTICCSMHLLNAVLNSTTYVIHNAHQRIIMCIFYNKTEIQIAYSE